MRVLTRRKCVLVLVLSVVIYFLATPIAGASYSSPIKLCGFAEGSQEEGVNPKCWIDGHDWNIEVIFFIEWPSPKTHSYCYKETILIDKYCTRFACGETDWSIVPPEERPHDWIPIPTGYQCSACSLYMN